MNMSSTWSFSTSVEDGVGWHMQMLGFDKGYKMYLRLESKDLWRHAIFDLPAELTDLSLPCFGVVWVPFAGTLARWRLARPGPLLDLVIPIPTCQ